MIRLTLVAGLLLALSCTHGPRGTTSPSALAPGEYDRVLNGVRLHYRIGGRGSAGRPPLLFLHGGPGYNSFSFAQLTGRRFEDSERMVYLDQRGCGGSERPWTRDYALATLVADVEALRRALGVERWVVMGHSFGGTLALEYAARHPEAVAGLIVVDGFSDAPGTYRSWARALEEWHARTLPQGEEAGFQQVMTALQGLDTKGFFDRMQWVDARQREEMERVDARSGLRNTGELSGALFGGELKAYRFASHARVQAPALVIIGRHDRAIGPETSRALAEALPHGTYLEYENSAHFPYLEEAERFEQDVRRFLATLRPTQAQ
ncbi:alpha/beta fold hydrolase [Myxococcus sp. Y35]|uniref:alpha/beta fold hydrolase n=1 Tax=Pseudomyxococcus flavus TaxID=3115648 RepID=UPI003CECA263